MRKHFITGLIILLPFTLTLILATFVIDLLTAPFQALFQSLLNYSPVNQPIWIFSNQQVLQFISRILAIISLGALIFLLGFFGQAVLVYRLLLAIDALLHRIPLFNKIYKAIQDGVRTLFEAKNSSFSQVVLVPFPHVDALTIGMISQQLNEATEEKEISVFIPGAINPTWGFMLLYKPKEMIFIDISVQEAFKLIVSCGVLFKPSHFKKAAK